MARHARLRCRRGPGSGGRGMRKPRHDDTYHGGEQGENQQPCARGVISPFLLQHFLRALQKQLFTAAPDGGHRQTAFPTLPGQG